MNCRNCGGVMRLVEGRAPYFACDYCTAFAFPTENPDGVTRLGRGTELNCPICDIQLETAVVGGGEVLQCRRCEGLLVYQEELPTILRERLASAGSPRPPQPIRPEELARKLACPMCKRSLDVHPYYGPGHILIDTCGGCAVIWLDRGEMDTISRASAHELTRKY